MSFYKRLRDLREDADRTQTDIAGYLGTTAQYYGKYEKGERELPLSRAIELAAYYDVSIDYLAGVTNVKKACSDAAFSEDEVVLIRQYRRLTEKNKGKAELFIDQLAEAQPETDGSQFRGG
ncbi:MAG: helix-turn-helix transcriptional regulator [Oscillospiraceae bacterium]|nr:helix-turn-helix transcriptional regulator [Oscillospiraceae bacterium]